MQDILVYSEVQLFLLNDRLSPLQVESDLSRTCARNSDNDRRRPLALRTCGVA